MVSKEKIAYACKQILRERIELVSREIQALVESMTSETKSPLGDKHETARARMQAETETLQRQLEETREMERHLAKLSLDPSNTVALWGSVVETNKGLFFLSVAIGKLVVDGQVVYAVSPISPIGKLLTGSKVGEERVVNGLTHTILKVF